ncbi:hypothetical protein BDR06DRAFT_1009285 [Suillus hirtellus]|nr:hypothetical protein BDR06DRAFT_1009285 [Suillus hirtellus]
MLTGTCLSAVNALVPVKINHVDEDGGAAAADMDVPVPAPPIPTPPPLPLPPPPPPPLINIDMDLNIDNGPTVLQTHPDDPHDPSDIPLAECPLYLSKIAVFNLASSRFYVLSDLSGIGGMRTEHIRSCPSSANYWVPVQTYTSLYKLVQTHRTHC